MSLAVLAVVASQSGLIAHTFRYEVAAPARSVHVAGTFNAWNKNADAMRLEPDGRTWQVTLQLRPGKHLYKFVVDGDRWTVDPRAARNEDDGNGNVNSVLLLLPPDYAEPARLGDGRVTASALAHATAVPDFNWDRGALTVSLNARPGDIREVEVQIGARRIPMQSVARDEITERYRARVPWDRRTDLAYAFRLNDGTVRYFGPKGLTESAAGNLYRVSAKEYKPFLVPEWVERTVIYQIFPDRFANGDKANDPADVMPWSAKPTYYNRFGGDFAGVASKMGYLRDLGVGAIYFNPIFQSPSNHRYEATDYYTVDPQLGTNEQFSKLTRDLKRSGIRTVLDGVFNHTAPSFFAFADVVNRGEASPYVAWYTFHSFPVRVGPNPNYDCWWGAPSMPKLNVLNPETKRYLLEIPREWHRRAEIAGWRLDVANEVPMPFWQEFRKVVKGLDANLWIVGEHWGESTPWLGGDQWDATMNYQFREAVLQLVGKGRSGKPSVFLDRLMHTYGIYAPQVSRNLMNLLGSHDTPRILTEAGGDRALAKLAAVVQFTWIGTPSIYYGDELGMEGGPDPDNRRGMAWDAAAPNNEFLQLYKKLVALRNKSRILQAGEPVRLMADDAQGTAAYARVLDRQAALVALNRSEQPRVVRLRLPAGVSNRVFRDELTGQPLRVAEDGSLSISLAPKRAAILMPLRGSTSRHRLPSRSVSISKGPRPNYHVHRSTFNHASE